MKNNALYCPESGWWDLQHGRARPRLRKKDSAPAPAPDPRIGEAAAQNVELGKMQLDFAKQQYADSAGRQDKYDALTSQVAQSALDSQNLANKYAQEDRDIQAGYRTKYDGWADQDRQLGRDTKAADDKLAADALAGSKKYESQFSQMAAYQNGLGKAQTDRYTQNFAPVEDRVASDAMNWDSAGRQDAMAAEARADAMGAGSQAAEQASRQMMAMGVNPNSGRFAATSNANNTAVALAAAGAQNAARDNVRQQAVSLRQQAAGIGQQLLASGQQANSLGMQATGAADQARTNGISTALQAQNQGLAAAGVGNTTASLGLSNQNGGYTGLGTGLQAGAAATGAAGAANQYNQTRGQAYMGGLSGAGATTASGGQLALGQYNSQLNAWGQQQQANAASTGGIMSGIGSLVGTGAALFL